MWLRASFLLWLVCGALALPALALTLEAPLKDAAQEARAKALFLQIRCVVCQGESIADSPADVAADFRREVRKRVSAGEGDEAILAVFVQHYGDGILMQPPLKPKTWLLWFSPLVILGFALLLAARYFRPTQTSRS